MTTLTWIKKYNQSILRFLFGTSLLACMAIICWSLAFEKPYLSYVSDTFPVVKSRVYGGEVLPMKVTRCNSDSKGHSYTISRYIRNVENGVSLLMPDVRVFVPPGCTPSVSLIHRIPDDVPPGRYRIHGVAEVSGRILMFNVEWQSAIFEVIE